MFFLKFLNWLSSIASIDFPWYNISPKSKSTNLFAIFKMVDLPLPFLPIKPIISLLFIVKEIFSNLKFESRYSLFTFTNSKITYSFPKLAIKIEALTPAFSDSILPFIGIFMVFTSICKIWSEIPFPSLPTTKASLSGVYTFI